ncbi:hypothetical protein BKA93DRAFT_751237 [Sparassis latifolia]
MCYGGSDARIVGWNGGYTTGQFFNEIKNQIFLYIFIHASSEFVQCAQEFLEGEIGIEDLFDPVVENLWFLEMMMSRGVGHGLVTADAGKDWFVLPFILDGQRLWQERREVLLRKESRADVFDDMAQRACIGEEDYVELKDILALRKTSKRFYSMTKLRWVWYDAMKRHVIAKSLPVPAADVDLRVCSAEHSKPVLSMLPSSMTTGALPSPNLDIRLSSMRRGACQANYRRT